MTLGHAPSQTTAWPTIDWPEDFGHLAQLTITDPGWWMPSPRLCVEPIDLPFFDPESGWGDVPITHEDDAIAPRANVPAEEQPSPRLPDLIEEDMEIDEDMEDGWIWKIVMKAHPSLRFGAVTGGISIIRRCSGSAFFCFWRRSLSTCCLMTSRGDRDFVDQLRFACEPSSTKRKHKRGI
jgi:hypothetical protein